MVDSWNTIKIKLHSRKPVNFKMDVELVTEGNLSNPGSKMCKNPLTEIPNDGPIGGHVGPPAQ